MTRILLWKRALCRKGTWLFAAALAWYVAASLLSAKLAQQDQALATKGFEQTFDTHGASNLSLSTRQTCGYDCRRIDIVLDPSSSQVKAAQNLASIDITSSTDSSTLSLQINKPQSRRRDNQGDLQVRIPPSIRRLEIDNLEQVFLSGSRDMAAGGLDIAVKHASTDVTVRHLHVNHLQIAYLAMTEAEHDHNGNELSIEQGARINRLDVSLYQGKLEYESDTLPEKTSLQLGKNVRVIAKPAFIKAASFKEFP